MFDKEEKNEKSGKLIEAISDDLFLIKLELKLLRIDRLDENGKDKLRTPFQRMFFCKRWLKFHIFWAGFDKGTVIKNDLEKESSKGSEIFTWLIKRGFLHRISETEGRLIKADINVIKSALKQEYPLDLTRVMGILEKSDKESINEVINQLYNNSKVSEGVGRNELIHFVDLTIFRRNRLIGESKKMILNGETTAREYRKEAMAGFERDKIGLSRIEALDQLNRIQWLCEVLKQMEECFKENNNLNEWKYEMPSAGGIKDESTAEDF